MRVLVLIFFIFFLTACALEQTLEENVSLIEETPSIKENLSGEEELSQEDVIIEEVVEDIQEEETLSFEEGWEKRIDAALAPRYCFPVEGLTFEGDSYQGKLVDTHYHIANIPDSDPSDAEEEEIHDKPLLGIDLHIADTVCTLQQENTDAVFAFFPVYPEIPEQMIEVAKRTIEKYPHQFVPFLMPPDHDDDLEGYPTVDAKTLEEMLEVYPGLFQGYGEIGLYEREGGSKELPPDSKRLQEIYPVLREHHLVVYFHLGAGHKDSLEKVAQENPDISFLFHGDQLGIEEIEELLETHPNIYYTVDELYGDVFLLRPEVSKEEFLVHFEEYESLLAKDLRTWKAVIERHPNQFMWGTDRNDRTLWSHDPEVGQTLANYARLFIAGLDPQVQEKFAYKNAEQLLS